MEDEMIAIPEAFEAFLAVGAKFKYKEMENGEKRYSVSLPNDSEWILTIAGREGGWQNAHYHGGHDALAGVSKEGIYEHYVVVQGWMAVARLHQGFVVFQLEVFKLNPNQSVSFKPGEPHNIYLPAGAVIHTIKTGAPVGNPNRKMNDWWPDQVLDIASKELTEVDILAQALNFPAEYYG